MFTASEVEVHGSTRYMGGVPTGGIYREPRFLDLYECTSEIQCLNMSGGLDRPSEGILI
jgi:alkylation response protein AidB-like acyl-CoA dehydrogenase